MKEVKNEVNETEELKEAFEAEFTEEETEERVSTLEHLKGIGSNLKEDASRAWNSKPMKAVRKGTRVVLGVTATVAAVGTAIAIGKELKKDDNPLLDAPEDEALEGDFEVEDAEETTEETAEETSNDGNIETEEN